MMSHLSIKDLVKESYQNAVEKGFWDEERHDGVLIALMHSELSEALEWLREKDPNMNKVAEEFADCVIRIADYSGAKGIDLEKAIIEKLEFNKHREWKHGKRF